MTEDEHERLTPAIDRLAEAHFRLHGLEEDYHFADPFRWNLNAFLRSLKEIPQLVSMGLQNRSGFPNWFRERRVRLVENGLIRYLADQCDFVVHRGMFKPGSSAFVGITEGRGLKIGMGFPIDPLTDSDAAMQAYLTIARSGNDVFGLLEDDEDSLPCVDRRWKLEPFGDADLVDLCAEAWLTTAGLVKEVVEELGGPEYAPNLECRHDLKRVRVRAYQREDLRAGRIEGFRLI